MAEPVSCPSPSTWAWVSSFPQNNLLPFTRAQIGLPQASQCHLQTVYPSLTKSLFRRSDHLLMPHTILLLDQCLPNLVAPQNHLGHFEKCDSFRLSQIYQIRVINMGKTCKSFFKKQTQQEGEGRRMGRENRAPWVILMYSQVWESLHLKLQKSNKQTWATSLVPFLPCQWLWGLCWGSINSPTLNFFKVFNVNANDLSFHFNHSFLGLV